MSGQPHSGPAGGWESRLLAGLPVQGPGPGPLLLAVSGGGDSVALLRLLARLAPSRGWRLVVGHVDHGLRRGSAADARFVARLAADLGVEFLLRRVRVEKNGASPEEAARSARRQALGDMAQEAGAGAIALAHTADDQAETLLMRALLGSGPSGLAGMRPWSPPWWRPLLGLRRDDLRAYLVGLGQAWREDPSNQAQGPLRNRLRRRVLPLIERTINPRAAEALGRLAELLAQEEELWEAWCQGAWARHGWQEGTSLCLEAAWLAAQAPARQRRLVRHLAGRLTGQGQHLLAPHVEQALGLIAGRPGRRLSLPGGLWACREHVALRLDRDEPLPDFRARLDGPGWVWLPHLGLWLAAEALPRPVRLQARGPEAWLPLALVRWPLVIRPPRPGERFRPLGAPGAKRLSRFLLDIKAPLWWRRRTVLVADEEGTWWAAPWSVAQRAGEQERAGPWLRLRLVDRANPPLYTHFFRKAPLPPEL